MRRGAEAAHYAAHGAKQESLVVLVHREGRHRIHDVAVSWGGIRVIDAGLVVQGAICMKTIFIII